MNVSCGRIENINDERRGCCCTMTIEKESVFIAGQGIGFQENFTDLINKF